MQKIKALFGGEAVAVYEPQTKAIEMLATVLGEGGLEYSNESKTLTGGSYAGAVKIEQGVPSWSFNASVKEITDGMFKVLHGATITEAAADATGYVGTPVDVVGTGLAAKITPTVISAKSGNLPFGKIYLEVTASGKGKVFVAGSLKQGVSLYKDESGAVTEELSLSAGGTLQLEDIGVQLAIASGATFTVGDRVAIDVRPVNTSGSEKITVKHSHITEKGLLVVYPRQSDGSIYLLDIPRVYLHSGLPLQFKERDFAEHSISGTPLVNPSTGLVYTLEAIKPER